MTASASTPGYRVRPMLQHELAIALQWAADEGWNLGLHDADSFYAADPQGFLVGELDGQPIASISAVRYGADFGFLGLYIVRPPYRGQGYGMRLWQAAMTHFGARAIGLDGVVAQQANYHRSGFVLAHRNIRYQGRVPDGLPAIHDPRLTRLSDLPARLLLAYDRPFFPAGRAAFLQAWLRQPGACALGLQQQGRLTGYGVMRPCRQGYKVGPLYADQPEGAACLLQALLRAASPGSPVFLDIPEPNDDAMWLADRFGMTPVFETARMYRGSPVPPDMLRTYGITSFELG